MTCDQRVNYIACQNCWLQLNQVVRVGLIEKVTFEQRLKEKRLALPLSGGRAFWTEAQGNLSLSYEEEYDTMSQEWREEPSGTLKEPDPDVQGCVS